jgi:hypothetical protein
MEELSTEVLLRQIIDKTVRSEFGWKYDIVNHHSELIIIKESLGCGEGYRLTPDDLFFLREFREAYLLASSAEARKPYEALYIQLTLSSMSTA